jgi:hypothetical protein
MLKAATEEGVQSCDRTVGRELVGLVEDEAAASESLGDARIAARSAQVLSR